MRMTEKEILISKALTEVWEWKDEVYKEIKNKTFEEKQRYFEEGLKEAVKLINGRLLKNPDGSYSIT